MFRGVSATCCGGRTEKSSLRGSATRPSYLATQMALCSPASFLCFFMKERNCVGACLYACVSVCVSACVSVCACLGRLYACVRAGFFSEHVSNAIICFFFVWSFVPCQKILVSPGKPVQWSMGLYLYILSQLPRKVVIYTRRATPIHRRHFTCRRLGRWPQPSQEVGACTRRRSGRGASPSAGPSAPGGGAMIHR